MKVSKHKLRFQTFLIISVMLPWLFAVNSVAQEKIRPGDPTNPDNIPSFYKSKLSDVENEILNVKKGEVKTIVTSPGGLPVFAVFYGEKEDFNSKANYNSAVGAGKPEFYANKINLKPVVYFIGPVHGQEGEGIAGLINLIHIAETGKDHRRKEWPGLKEKMDHCRTIIIPCGNPDGRKRCPYDAFIGLPTSIKTKYGQGTRKDGTSWGWPMTKSAHPMIGDVDILGAYFNNDGINMMHDDFFNPMANETKAILEIARNEAPDLTVSLHSHEYRSCILLPAYVPLFMKEQVFNLAVKLNETYKNEGLEHLNGEFPWKPECEDPEPPAKTSFNLISALHHVSGTMAFTYECCHGSVSEIFPEPIVGYHEILDMQLMMYDEMYGYALQSKEGKNK
jgi:hypothetical protein